MDLKDKAQKVVSLDYEINGDFVNAPYKISHEGETYKVEIYKVEVPAKDGGSSYFSPRMKIIRPIQILGDHAIPV